MKKIIVVLGILIVSYMYGEDSLDKELDNIWVGVSINYFNNSLNLEKKGNFCIQTKIKEKVAYFYFENEKPIVFKIEKIGDKEYALVFKESKLYFQFKLGKKQFYSYLNFKKTINEKYFKRNDTNTFGVSSFLEINKEEKIKKMNFTNTAEGCLQYLKWANEEYEKMGIEAVPLQKTRK